MSSTEKQKINLLHAVALFAELDEREIQGVAAVTKTRHFQAKSKIVCEGDSGDSCYIISRGRLRAVRSQSRRLVTLAQFQPGDIFGELALFDDEVRSATVEALTDVELLAIQGPELRRLVAQYPTIALKLLTALARRLRATSDRLAGRSLQSVDQRVLTLLCELAQETEADQIDGNLTIVTTQQEIAETVGASRESVSRFLAVLDRAGCIIQRQGKVLIPNLETLKDYDDF